MSAFQVWAATVPKNSRLVCLPFLPVNPDYGTTRNQGRQKLARLDAREFAVLVRDVLKVRSKDKWVTYSADLRCIHMSLTDIIVNDKDCIE